MNRHDRRAATKRSKMTRAEADRNLLPVGMHYHATVHDGTAERSVYNLRQAQVLERVAVPYKLNRRFRIDGFEIIPTRVRRLKITRTPVPFHPSQALKSVDLSSLGSAIATIAAAADQINAAEDVTDDILIQAEQQIKTQGLAAEPRNALDAVIQRNKAFVVMSFATESREAFDAIKEACERQRINAVRVDEEISSGPVMDRTIAHLKEAKYVIADLTGARPNVYYEIGYFDALCEARGADAAAHMLFVASNIDSDAHFDLRHRGIEEYSSTFSLMKIVEGWLHQRGLA